MLGEYKLAPMEACKLPEDVAAGFAQVTGSLCGADYTPALYVGSQVVNGVNHMLICKQRLAAQGAPEHLVKLELHQGLDDGGKPGNWSVLSIEQIV